MTTQFEDALRRLLDDAAPEPPEGSAPQVTAPTHRFGRWLPLAAAAVVLLIVVGILAGRAQRGGDAATRPSAIDSTHAVTAPPGMKTIAYYGISVQVPVSWPVKPSSCDFYPHHNSVSPETGEPYSCPAQAGPAKGPDPAYTTVTLVSSAFVDLATTRRTRVDGVPAVIATRGSAGQSSGTLVIESRQVAIEVVAPTAAKVKAVLNTVHIALVDSLGCTDRAPTLNDATGSPAGTAPDAFIPGVPTRVVICQYDTTVKTYRLVGSRELSATQTIRLQHQLNSGTAANRVQDPITARVRYVFHYANSSVRMVEGTLDLDPPEVTDGSRTVTVPYGGSGLPGAFG